MANEKRLIDANALNWRASQKKMVELFPNWKEIPQEVKDMLCKHGKEFERLLKEAPTVDAVEVVRCKDCKFYELKNYVVDNIQRMCCENNKGIWTATQPDDFCSYGERRDGE